MDMKTVKSSPKKWNKMNGEEVLGMAKSDRRGRKRTVRISETE